MDSLPQKQIHQHSSRDCSPAQQRDLNTWEFFEAGAVALFSKPFNYERLFECIQDCYRDPPKRHDHIEPPASLKKIELTDPLPTHLSQVGRGGVQLHKKAFSKDHSFFNNLKEGEKVELNLRLPQSEKVFRSIGQLAWIKNEESIGILFTQTSEDDLQVLHEYLIENKITSFIPLPKEDSHA